MSIETGLIGRRIPRREDGRFLTGTGSFVDDLQPPGLLHGVLLRSPHAHARLVGLDVAAARELPGVALVLTAIELLGCGLDVVPVDLAPPGRSFDDWEAPAQPILAQDVVRFVGDPIAFVVAETRQAATDAAEAVRVAFEDLPASLDMRAAPALFDYAEGDAEATAAAFAAATRVVRASVANNRIDAAPLETRGCVGAYEAGRFTLHVSTQRVQIIQRALADRVFKVPREQVRVVAPDTGGGFGQKNGLYAEYVLCLEAARRLGRPVKWIADRSEALAGDCHGRDNLFEADAAIDRGGSIAAIRATRHMNMGAYASSRAMVPVANGLTHVTGVYGVRSAHVSVRGALTNTAPTCSYRGAGRPENVFCCERLIEMVARALGEDPIALRRRLLVRPDAMPWTTPLGTTFEGHEFAALLDQALAALDHDAFSSRRAEAATRDCLRGFGICLFAEDLHGSQEPNPARLALHGNELVLVVSTGSAGHGHETSFLQIAAERLCLPMDRLGFAQSDTDIMSFGVGTAASWSLTLAGSSVRLAAEAAVQEGCRIAGTILEAAGDDILFGNGRFGVVGTDLSVGWSEIFRAEPAFRVDATFTGEGRSVPAGCHACEVEVDPETGAIAILGFAVAQDSGLVVNPTLFEGQLHGGVAQGVGQGWMERIAYDPDSGQLLTGAFTDYAIPRADDLPPIETRIRETPASDNPLGVKGVGESATTGAMPAFVNAVLDALWPLGILHLDPPLTPAAVWTAIRQARTRP